MGTLPTKILLINASYTVVSINLVAESLALCIFAATNATCHAFVEVQIESLKFHTQQTLLASVGRIVRIENSSHSLSVTGDTRLTLQLGDDIKLNWQQSLISIWLRRNPICSTANTEIRSARRFTKAGLHSKASFIIQKSCFSLS